MASESRQRPQASTMPRAGRRQGAGRVVAPAVAGHRDELVFALDDGAPMASEQGAKSAVVVSRGWWLEQALAVSFAECRHATRVAVGTGGPVLADPDGVAASRVWWREEASTAPLAGPTAIGDLRWRAQLPALTPGGFDGE